MSSQMDTPTRKTFTNGVTTSPLINGSSTGGLGLSSLGRNYARSNLFRNSQPLPSAEVSVTGSGETPEKSQVNSPWIDLVADMSRQICECTAELIKSREFNSQMHQQVQSLMKRLDDATGELHTSRVLNQQLSQKPYSIPSDNISNKKTDETLSHSIKILNDSLNEMRLDIQRMRSQLQNIEQKNFIQNSSSTQVLEQQTALLLRGMQQQQESSAVAMATMNAAFAMMLQQQRAPVTVGNPFTTITQMPPQMTPAPLPLIPQIPPGQLASPINQQIFVANSPSQSSAKYSTATSNIFSQQPANSSVFKKSMLMDIPPFPPKSGAQTNPPAQNIFSSMKPVSTISPAKSISTVTTSPFTAPVITQTSNSVIDKQNDPIFDKFKPKEGSWNCDVCLLNNDSTSVACKACQAPKPGCKPAQVSNSSSTIFSGAKISMPKFSFGSNKSTNPVPVTENGLFSFGTSGQLKPKDPVLFKFDAPTQPPKPQEVSEPTVTANSDDEEVEQCDEDKLYFKPVLEKLPDKITVVTGEENQVVLFENNAKLFRFRDNQWVERGHGMVRILEDPSSKKTRLLMRQEQTFKICCNHPLLKPMTLSPMSGAKDDSKSLELSKSWTWWAVDFAEPVDSSGKVEIDSNGGHKESFAIRFSKLEPAQDFYRIFMNCCGQTVEKESNSDCQILNVESVSLDQKQRAEALQLPSQFFSYENGIKTGESDHMTEEELKEEDKNLADAIKAGLKQTSAKIPIISSTKIADTVSKTPEVITISKNVSFFSSNEKSTSGFFSNPSSVGATVKTTPEGLFSSTSSGNKNKTPLTGLFSSSDNSNKTPLFASRTLTNSLTGVLLHPAKISSNEEKSTDKSTTNIFNVAETKNMLDFNQLSSSTPGKEAPKPAWLSSSQDAPKWGTTKPLFASQSRKTEDLIEVQPSEDAEGYMVEDPSYDPQYQAIVSLPEVEVKTGEENEICFYLSRARVYRLTENEWKERGIGDLKILVTPHTKVAWEINPREEFPQERDSELKNIQAARILMRREQVLKICLNQTISPKSPFNFVSVGGSKRVVCWKGVDYSSGTAETETFSLKFKNEEEYTRFTKCLERVLKLPRVDSF